MYRKPDKEVCFVVSKPSSSIHQIPWSVSI